MAHLIEKDGWHIALVRGGIEWQESNPTYTTKCTTCGGTGSVPNPNCGCDDGYGAPMGMGCFCTIKCHCKNGKMRDEPKFKRPSEALLKHIGSKLWRKMSEIGHELEVGNLEKELAEKQAKEAALSSAGL